MRRDLPEALWRFETGLPVDRLHGSGVFAAAVGPSVIRRLMNLAVRQSWRYSYRTQPHGRWRLQQKRVVRRRKHQALRREFW